MSAAMLTSTPFSSVPRMSAPQVGHWATAAWQAGHAGGGTLLLARHDRHAHAGKCIHHRRCPAVLFPACLAGRVVGTVEVQTLILARRGGIDDGGRGVRQHRSESRPVRAERLVGIAHGERVVPEVYEHADAVAWAMDRIVTGHYLSVQNTGTHEASLGSRLSDPVLPVWAVVRWAVLRGNVSRNGLI